MAEETYLTMGRSWYVMAGTLLSLILAVTLANNSPESSLRTFLKNIGVKASRLDASVKELKRKGFHFGGLFIPCAYLIGLNYTTFFDHRFAATMMCSVAILFSIGELVRLYVWEGLNRFLTTNLKFMMRKDEEKSFTGIFYYLLGCAGAVLLFEPLVAIAGILFLVVGDFMAALIGISYGQTKIYGKKSLEGAFACFVSCFVVALLAFYRLEYPEQLAFWGALGATLTELYNPDIINDNLSIPLVSGLCVNLIAWRLGVTIPYSVKI